MIVKRKKTKITDKPGNKGIESVKEVEKKKPGFYENIKTSVKSSSKKLGKAYKNTLSDSFHGLFDSLD